MAQNYPFVGGPNPATTTGVQLAQAMGLSSQTQRTMGSGPSRAADFIEGLWLRTNANGTAEIVYSNASQNVDLALFEVAAGGGSIKLTPHILLTFADAATKTETGVVQLATEVEALAGTHATKVTAVAETKAMIQRAIDALVNGSAAALDTLNELATALGNDPNFATTMADALAKRVRVDGDQTFTSSEQAKARDNMGLGSLAVQDTIKTSHIDDKAVTTSKISNSQVTRAKLAPDVFASSAQVLSGAAPTDRAIKAADYQIIRAVRVVDLAANMPTSLAGNAYHDKIFLQEKSGYVSMGWNH